MHDTIALIVTVTALPQDAGPADSTALSPHIDLVAAALLDDMFVPVPVQEPADDTPLPGTPMTERYGSEGTWRFEIHGAGAIDVDSGSNTLGQVGVSWNYFFADNLSWNFGVNGIGVWQLDDDAWGITADLLFRWHFVDNGDWSVFADGGAGVVIFTEEVPFDGSEFNFTPQAGVGMSFEIQPHTRMLVGVRWHHISNASLYSDNPGRDNVLFWAGVSLPW